MHKYVSFEVNLVFVRRPRQEAAERLRSTQKGEVSRAAGGRGSEETEPERGCSTCAG